VLNIAVAGGSGTSPRLQLLHLWADVYSQQWVQHAKTEKQWLQLNFHHIYII
jgi:hypothetical protein